LVMGLTTWQRTTMAKRRRMRASILVGRSNKGIHVQVQDNHSIREYLRVQARAYISSKGMVHKHSRQATMATNSGS
jgi:ABC-type lipopolysaccharide export system ATPase subunit